jgi:type I restriction enzyme S subunit
MFVDLKPYAQYRRLNPTGTAPAHWGARALRSLITQRTERNQPDLPLLSVARQRGVFVRTADDDNHNVVPEDLTNYKVARAGDLVINKMKAWQGSLGLAPCDGLVSPAYFVYRFGIADKFYGQALLRSRPYVAHFGAASDGVRVGQWDLSIPRLREIPVLEPPPEEQAAIVRYIAHANRRIDQAIAAKRKLIQLLDEQKQVIINQAVTRGLDPTVPLKDSGSPWLGTIPAHWLPTATGRLVSLVTSGSRGWAEFYSDEGAIFLQSGNIGRDMRLNLSRIQRVDVPSDAEGSRTRVQQRDVLVCITGALTGNVALVEEEFDSPAYVNQHVAIVRPRRELVDPMYLATALRSPQGQAQFKAEEYGGTKQGLGLADVKGVKVPLPPTLAEQREIVDLVTAESKGITEAIGRSVREICLLSEFRNRLTADVVTGQVDVREIAATLPDLDPQELVVLEDLGSAQGDEFDEVANEYLDES